ncbi:MAG: TlpA family protein disulfide reductase [Flexistipes sinusarabici]|uniref:TlpA family protein disulfide reductase n=1 Tax=Flexistipes sinusarabici TaxID=2352 RepID=A0A5D0MGX1_FLESI|nr:TlpA disulfide reductase family protein [Flexistipes sinusarabici]TYB32964.1 MAG: TlpA family protein disulfide reductase [Flexistipes sinusarabici]
MKKINIRWMILPILIAGAFYITACTDKTDVQTGNFTTMDKAGYTDFLEKNKGKVVLVNVFASWCPSCQYEMPLLNNIYSDFKENNFVMIGLSIDRKMNDLSKFIKEYNVDFPVYLGADDLMTNLKITGVPETFLYDKKGKLVNKTIGPINENYSEKFKNLL